MHKLIELMNKNYVQIAKYSTSKMYKINNPQPIVPAENSIIIILNLLWLGVGGAG